MEPTIVQPAIYQLFGANWLNGDGNSISWFPCPFPNASSEPLHSSCPIKLLMCQRGPNSGSLGRVRQMLDRAGTPLQRKPSHASRILGHWAQSYLGVSLAFPVSHCPLFWPLKEFWGKMAYVRLPSKWIILVFWREREWSLWIFNLAKRHSGAHSVSP